MGLRCSLVIICLSIAEYIQSIMGMRGEVQHIVMAAIQDVSMPHMIASDGILMCSIFLCGYTAYEPGRSFFSDCGSIQGT